MKSDKNNKLTLEEAKKRAEERKKRLKKIHKPIKDDYADFALDKFYHNYMDGPY